MARLKGGKLIADLQTTLWRAVSAKNLAEARITTTGAFGLAA